MGYASQWLVLLLFAAMTYSREGRLGFFVTFGVLLSLVLLTLLVTALVKLLLPDGPLKRGLLQLRGRRHRAGPATPQQRTSGPAAARR